MRFSVFPLPETHIDSPNAGSLSWPDSQAGPLVGETSPLALDTNTRVFDMPPPRTSSFEVWNRHIFAHALGCSHAEVTHGLPLNQQQKYAPTYPHRNHYGQPDTWRDRATFAVSIHLLRHTVGATRSARIIGRVYGVASRLGNLRVKTL